MHTTNACLLSAALLLASLALGCGGRPYDGSGRTVSCGRLGVSDACIERGVRTRSARVRACYEAELARDPTLAGEITVELTIEEDGETTGVHAQDDTMGNAVVRECVLGIVSDMLFTPGSAGGPTNHRFPLVFQPDVR